ncbi:phage major capsid protein [Cypionkella sp.]|uniref:phage major capsid protein n=1 Tax=Cypionkella sp. TaxID=2811411 RepID=UPI00272322DD|nr:phage major capsid protein [Cypionkella sp.]MDO8985575.1 phage major capsid protein [Cypionkella sp.]MDP2048760.1 phage major capsid protein [Cypionkella sp.]
MTDRIEFKAAFAVDDAGEITGTAWPFSGPDRVGDVITKGAFTAPASLPMLFAHDQAQVIGVWNEITETAEGLTVKGRLLVDDVARAAEVRAMIQAGAVSGLSIGFVTKSATPRPRGRTIAALDLFEISIVAIPSHPGAVITSIKAANAENTPEENTMTDETQTPANAPQIDTKAFDAMKARLDQLEAKSNRPHGAHVSGAVIAPERKAFVSFLQGGEFDKKALTVANDAPAYVLAPEEVSGEFIRNLIEFSPIRAIADVRTTASHNVLLPKRTGVTNALWVGEVVERTASQPSFDQGEIAVKELATFVDLSLRMLEDSANVEAEVRLALAEDFGMKEAVSFVNGATAVEPTGFMTAAGIAETNNGHATNLSADALIKLFYSMPATYRNRGTWVMNGTTLAVLRTLKDTTGQYLWQPSYQAGQPETILGRPVVEALDMPNVANATTPIIFGDFKAGYRIYDRIALDVLPDLLTQRTVGMARFHARRRVGAGVTSAAVFRKLKMAV